MEVVKADTDMSKALSKAANGALVKIENTLAQHKAGPIARQATWMTLMQAALQKAVAAGFPIDKFMESMPGRPAPAAEQADAE